MSDPSSVKIHPISVVDEGAIDWRRHQQFGIFHISVQVLLLVATARSGKMYWSLTMLSLGNNVKIQNNVAIYGGVTVEDDVFLGPSCVLTNVTNPRSQVSRKTLYEKILIRRGATVGANATIVCGTTLGRYCFIGAGAVVTKDVPDYALVIGNPGKLSGFMSRHGHKLHFDENNQAICPESNYWYEKAGEGVRCLDLDEDKPLPDELSVGSETYDSFK